MKDLNPYWYAEPGLLGELNARPVRVAGGYLRLGSAGGWLAAWFQIGPAMDPLSALITRAKSVPPPGAGSPTR